MKFKDYLDAVAIAFAIGSAMVVGLIPFLLIALVSRSLGL